MKSDQRLFKNHFRFSRLLYFIINNKISILDIRFYISIQRNIKNFIKLIFFFLNSLWSIDHMENDYLITILNCLDFHLELLMKMFIHYMENG